MTTITHCTRCNRILKDSASIQRGMGNTCWRKSANRGRRTRTKKQRVEFDWRQLDLPLMHHEPVESSFI